MTRRGHIRVLLVAILFGIAIVLLLSISTLAWMSRSGFDRSLAKATFYRQLDRGVSRLEEFNLLAESSQRRFLLTGEEAFLDRYEMASAEVEKLLEKLDVDLAPLPGMGLEYAELKKKIRVREQQLERAISARRTGGFTAALEALQVEGEDSLSDEIRARVIAIRDQTTRHLVEAEQTYRAEIRRTTWLMNLAAATALGAGIAGIAFLFGHLQARSREVELEREKDAAERSDREKTQFLARVNHEIRTPLNAMLGFTELLEEEISHHRGRRFLQSIQKSGESLAALINDILDLSKIESGVLELDEEPIRIREFARSIEILFKPATGEKDLDYRVDVDPDLPEVVTVDSLRVRQILVNLVGNAIKFTETGSILVRFRAEEDPDDGERKTLIFEVEDTGRGIAPEKRSVIFKPFQQASVSDEMRGGTGLGLSICRELASLMGGRMELESELGKGSLFRFVLPGARVGGEASETPESVSSGDFDQLPPSRILVVDDNAYNRDLIGSFLENTHHRLRFAVNGREALGKLENDSFDLVLMDIRMPVMDGEEAQERMRENPSLSDIPVIAVTASSLDREQSKLRKLFDGYLRKPFTGAQLYAAIRAVTGSIGEPPAPRESPDDAPPEPSAAPPEKTGGSNPGGNAVLRGELQAIHDERWRELTEAMVFGDVRSTAEDLLRMGEEFESPSLIDYARKLQSLVDAFDQAGLERQLSRFRDLIASL